MTKFSKLCSESFRRDSDRRCVQILWNFWPTGYRWNRALPNWQKTNFAWLSSCRYCQGQHPAMYSECCRLHPNWFTFGGVIAQRVITAKTRCKVNPIFGRSPASIRIIILGVFFRELINPNSHISLLITHFN